MACIIDDDLGSCICEILPNLPMHHPIAGTHNSSLLLIVPSYLELSIMALKAIGSAAFLVMPLDKEQWHSALREAIQYFIDTRRRIIVLGQRDDAVEDIRATVFQEYEAYFIPIEYGGANIIRNSMYIKTWIKLLKRTPPASLPYVDPFVKFE